MIQLMDAIPSDVPVILDCKRGDIDTTAQVTYKRSFLSVLDQFLFSLKAYAIASYDIYLADAVTLHGYMGWDSIKPFVTDKYKNKGVFTLCKTSNPSSKV